MNEKQITEVTRRNISDALVLNKVNWSGRFEEQQFLARLYDVSAMPSTDRRYSTASEDIWKHRVMNSDWSDDWVFYDSPFNLINAPDEEFVRFLCEMLHPAVQSRMDEVERIRALINEHLVKDGWELREQMAISGRPVFGAARVVEINTHTTEAAKVVTQSIDAEYVSRQVTRMQSALASEPDMAIGTAKEFVETICKTILRERGLIFDPNEKMPRLVKQVAAALDLIPKDISDHSKASETVKRLLSNLGTVSDGLAELRNLHGTGHGKDASTVGLELRHARLAVGAATTLAVFLWESHTVRSPGAPLLPITMEQMQAFTAPMYNRNPKLQFAFGGAKLVEGRGFGMRTLGEAATKYGLPMPRYAFDGLYLNLTIYRHVQAAVQALGAAVLEKLSKSERLGWEWLAAKGHARSSEYAAKLGVDERTARRHLNQFLKLGLVRQTGASTSTEYQIK